MKINRRKLAIFSWGMYDFANTIFSMNVISLYFALWVTSDMHGQDIYYSWALSGSMLCSALSAPLFGAMSDKLGRKMPFLISFTILSCIFTALISTADSLLAGLIFFTIANFGYQLGDVFYNSLLPHLASKEKTGRTSGFGVGLGYFGTIAGLIMVGPFALRYGRQMAFLPTAILFLLFALPCFFFVKDQRKSEPVKRQFSFANIRKYPNLLIFFIAAFIALNAINTVFVFMSVYTEKVMHFTDPQILILYMASSVFAILGAFGIGFITDRFGPKKTLTGVLLLWSCAAFLAMLSTNKMSFWLIGPMVGISLGGTWTSARTLVVALSPAEISGEVFGFYGLVGKTASIIGPLIWGLCVWAFGSLGIIKYRIAIGSLVLFLLAGMFILQKVGAR